jgi:hypothetical protein
VSIASLRRDAGFGYQHGEGPILIVTIPNLAAEIETAAIRQPGVDKRQIGTTSLDEVQALSASLSFQDLEAAIREQMGERRSALGLAIHD